MVIDGWKYYNHAAIPTCAPHEQPNLNVIEDGSVWKMRGKPYLARWTEDYDCAQQTDWWYCIQDKPFDISQLKAKRRYEINKGRKNFTVKVILPQVYREDLFEIECAAFSSWPEKYRPKVNKDRYLANLPRWQFYKVYGAFCAETDTLCGYAILDKKHPNVIDFRSMRVNPAYEAKGINAALVDAICSEQKDFLENGGYICDGSRSVNHETAFQDYLEKYFGFRKAYCKLRLVFRFPLNLAIGMLYPLRKLLKKFGDHPKIHRINGLLMMEEICRKNKT